MFNAWFEALGKVRFHSAKDVTKGGLVSVVYEMSSKSGRDFTLDGNPPFHMSRNLDNIIATMKASEFLKLKKVCKKHGCSLARIGSVD
jgi:selenophosphate synthetase-related protein